MVYYPTALEAGNIDKYTIEEIGIPQLVLMERAALAVTNETEKMLGFDKNKKVLAVVEAGNNGGDGLAASRILKLKGYNVDAFYINGISKKSEAFIKQLELAKKAGVNIFYPVFDDDNDEKIEKTKKLLKAEDEIEKTKKLVKTEDEIEKIKKAEKLDQVNLDKIINDYHLIIDGIFGIGLSRPVTGPQLKAINTINASGKSVISVDIPSGVSADTGKILGEAIKADKTISFGYRKIGSLFEPGNSMSGQTIVADIGFYRDKEKEIKHFGYEAREIRNLLPARKNDSNKGSYGRVLIIAGSENISGAAYLSALAAYRTGAGLVKIITHENNRKMIQEMLPEALLYCYKDVNEALRSEIEKSLSWAEVLVLGPGLATDENAKKIVDLVTEKIKSDTKLIIDADAINILASKKEVFNDLYKKDISVIATPHMLEMARLLKDKDKDLKEIIEYIKNNRSKVAINAAKDYHITLVLKDARTFVANDNEEKIYVNTSGNSGMSTGGSGDVLTGVIAALIAAGAESVTAARLGVYLHGRAGDLVTKELGEHSLMARDIADYMGRAISTCI